MNKLNALQTLRKGSFAIARIVSKKKPLKAYAQHDITKVILCTVRTGIEFRNQKEVKESGKEVGSLPWGEWESYPYAITHKGNRYLRLYLGQSLKVFYLVDGVKVAKPKGAFYCIAELPLKNADAFAQWLLEVFDYQNKTIMVAPAAGFYSSPDLGLNQIRIAYVLKKSDLINSVKILKEALKVYTEQ